MHTLIIKTSAEINAIKNRKVIEKIDKNQILFFVNINKIDKLLGLLTKAKR